MNGQAILQRYVRLATSGRRQQSSGSEFTTPELALAMQQVLDENERLRAKVRHVKEAISD